MHASGLDTSQHHPRPRWLLRRAAQAPGRRGHRSERVDLPEPLAEWILPAKHGASVLGVRPDDSTDHARGPQRRLVPLAGQPRHVGRGAHVPLVRVTTATRLGQLPRRLRRGAETLRPDPDYQGGSHGD